MDHRGSAVVEFALVVPVLLLAFVAAIEVAVVSRAQLEVVNAAREGAREAAASPDPSRAVRAARTALGERGADARVSVSRPDVVGAMATVRVTLPYRVGAPVFGGFSIDLTGRSAMRVER